MNTLADKAKSAFYVAPSVVVRMESGAEWRFPAMENPRLNRGTPAQLNNIEISPFGLHWPDLDEDLSFEGLSRGDFGQGSRWAAREET